MKPIFLLALALLSACSSSNDGSYSPEAPEGLTRAPFDTFRLRDQYLQLVTDSFQPKSLDDAAQATLLVRQWFANENAESDGASYRDWPLVDSLACDQGDVSRLQQGNPIVREFKFEFNDCTLGEYTYGGVTTVTADRFDCSGPNLKFAFAETTIINRLSTIRVSGKVSYFTGTINCGSGAGGPPGGYHILNLDIPRLETTTNSVTTTYTNLHAESSNRAPSISQPDFRMEIAHQANAIIDNPMGRISISLERPLLISSSPSVEYSGQLKIDAEPPESISYKFAPCAKELIHIAYTDTQGKTSNETVAWDDARNMLSQIRPPSVLYWGGLYNPAYFTANGVPYNSQQDIEGC